MKVAVVKYRKLVTGPGYSNQAVEAEAVVEDGESPEDALLALSMWVRNQMADNGALIHDPETLRQEVKFLTGQREQLRHAVSSAQAEKRKLQDEIVDLEVKREKAGGEPAMPF